MYVEASPQVDTRTLRNREGEEYTISEQACGFWAPGEFFPVPFRLRLRDGQPPFKPGRYALQGKPNYRPYERRGETIIPDMIAFERFELVPMNKAQLEASEAFRAAFSGFPAVKAAE